MGQSWGVEGQEESAGQRERKKLQTMELNMGLILEGLPHRAEACFCFVFLFSMEDGLKFLWNDVQSYFAFFLGYFFLSH